MFLQGANVSHSQHHGDVRGLACSGLRHLAVVRNRLVCDGNRQQQALEAVEEDIFIVGEVDY